MRHLTNRAFPLIQPGLAIVLAQRMPELVKRHGIQSTVVQGYLTHKKTHPPGTLLLAYA